MNGKKYTSDFTINKDSNMNLTKNIDDMSEFTSISNLHVLPNSKMKSLFILSSNFNFGVLLSALIYSVFKIDYLINISYIKDKKNPGDFFSVFNLNFYMFFIFLLCILFVEISKIFYFFFGFEVKKLIKFIYMEISYWFIVIKLLFGFNILISFLHVENFYYVFITSTVINFLIICKKIFYLKSFFV
jgi:hypothetical protein